ncbi:diguanylate cyclase with GAF sensor [Psychromonas ingrahamii 37]|uniref:Diguanylate cyclase with GAF sensor n=1 Tax=Psychromonas ingrahamii (strain DSM 17664 / CCUG 51855 / 37) TaxID=357804 RepID=A1SVH2_PSYIN|nr:sensor domain-containing diguanylate cyclase [Psychromonas ingrahamii]ABM03487.1 diguanylate cyclase with GAF sensor [Psychromonas ingrahamii 37]
MKKPDIPQDEGGRLKALRSLDVLDTPSEERFDRLTRLAKRMFDVPIALVSLVDENRQWFKSCTGINVSEIPRDISFCGHAILENEIFIIPDTIKDERFSDNPLVLNEPYIRFYAGCPLRYLDGSTLGTLCIIDTQPRVLDEEDLDALKDLAELAEHELMAVQLATQDELTKLSNRRGFIKLAQHGLDICARHNISASLVFFDLNKFKSINDTFGHAEGDAALLAFSDHMKNTFRDSDIIGRLGGDEFAVLLTDTSLEPAEKTISRFRSSIEHYNKESNLGYEISFSEGIVEIDHEKNISLESLLGQADSLMYDNKL